MSVILMKAVGMPLVQSMAECYLSLTQKEMSASGLFLHGEPNHMNEENITIHFDLDPKNLSTTDWSHFDAMTEQERHTAALNDPDSLPTNQEQLARARRVPNVRTLRRKLNVGVGESESPRSPESSDTPTG